MWSTEYATPCSFWQELIHDRYGLPSVRVHRMVTTILDNGIHGRRHGTTVATLARRYRSLRSQSWGRDDDMQKCFTNQNSQYCGVRFHLSARALFDGCFTLVLIPAARSRRGWRVVNSWAIALLSHDARYERVDLCTRAICFPNPSNIGKCKTCGWPVATHA